MAEVTLKSPLAGTFVSLKDVADETFATKILGDGFAIEPVNGLLKSPAKGKIVQFFRTGHALGLMSDEGLEILVHVGIDTVKLKGEGFRPQVGVGAEVSPADLLLEFDLDRIKSSGKLLTTPVVITNMDKVRNLKFKVAPGAKVEVGDDVLSVELVDGERTDL